MLKTLILAEKTFHYGEKVISEELSRLKVLNLIK